MNRALPVESLGAKVRAAREAKGLSQEKLAALAGVSQTTIDKIERGITKRSRLLHYIAAPLGLLVQELDPEMYGAPPPKTIKSTLGEMVNDTKFMSEEVVPIFTLDQIDDEGTKHLPEGEPMFEIGSIPLDYMARPSIINGSSGAYALYVSDSLMEPEFSIGDIAFLDPRLPAIKGSSALLLPNDKSNLRIIGRIMDISSSHWEIMQWQRNYAVKFRRSDWPYSDRIVAKYYRR